MKAVLYEMILFCHKGEDDSSCTLSCVNRTVLWLHWLLNVSSTSITSRRQLTAWMYWTLSAPRCSSARTSSSSVCCFSAVLYLHPNQYAAAGLLKRLLIFLCAILYRNVVIFIADLLGAIEAQEGQSNRRIGGIEQQEDRRDRAIGGQEDRRIGGIEQFVTKNSRFS